MRIKEFILCGLKLFVYSIRPTKGKRKRPVEDLDESVRVNIGIMLYDDVVGLKKQRGKGLRVSLKKNTTKDVLLKVSVDKHVAHSKDVINPRHEYRVLYPDGTVVDKLKESHEEFVLHKYKSECGKPYDRISFFLCPAIDYARATLQNFAKSDSDISLSSCSESNDDSREIWKSNARDDTFARCEKKSGSSGVQHSITNYAVNVDADQSSAAGNSSTAISNDCTSVCNVIGAEHDVVSVVDVVSTINEDGELRPSSSDDIFSLSNARSRQDTQFNTLMEMFPQLTEDKINEALVQGNYNIESAVTHVLSGSISSTPQQVYAALDFCNTIDEDQPQDEHINDINELESVKNESSIQEESLSVEGSSVIPLSTIIRELSVGKFDPESPLRIKIRRSHVWQDTLFKFKRCSENDMNKLIKVQFIGEPAVDEGGPRNEYFSLLHREMASSSLFVGEPGSKCFNHNIIALEQKEYLFYGQLCSLAILQHSPSPCFFSSSVVDYIVYGKLVNVSTCVEDVPNAKAKKKLEELQSISDPDQFKQVASFDCSLRFKAGYAKPLVTIEDKDDLIRCISLHYLLLSGLVELEQFIEGLKLNGMLQRIREHPRQVRHLFMSSAENRVTAEMLYKLFICMFSPEGSNKRASEEAIALNFFRYLEAVDANEVKSNLLDLTTDEETEITLSQSDVLQFITGCSTVPATGFIQQPSVRFDHGDTSRKLHVNSCGNILTLPVTSALTDFESFKNEFTSCLVNSPGFGNP